MASGYDDGDGVEVFRHEVSVWTVGDLRAALEGIADETPVRVFYAEEPGEEFGGEQVVIGANLDDQVWEWREQAYRPARSPEEAWFTVEAEFPSGDYERLRVRR